MEFLQNKCKSVLRTTNKIYVQRDTHGIVLFFLCSLIGVYKWEIKSLIGEKFLKWKGFTDIHYVSSELKQHIVCVRFLCWFLLLCSRPGCLNMFSINIWNSLDRISLKEKRIETATPVFCKESSADQTRSPQHTDLRAIILINHSTFLKFGRMKSG